MVQRGERVSRCCATSGSRSLGQRRLATSAKAALISRGASIRGQTQNCDPEPGAAGVKQGWTRSRQFGLRSLRRRLVGVWAKAAVSWRERKQSGQKAEKAAAAGRAEWG